MKRRRDVIGDLWAEHCGRVGREGKKTEDLLWEATLYDAEGHHRYAKIARTKYEEEMTRLRHGLISE